MFRSEKADELLMLKYMSHNMKTYDPYTES
jgi:hypothetical protein